MKDESTETHLKALESVSKPQIAAKYRARVDEQTQFRRRRDEL
jgi:hypothetical protein